MQNETIPSVFTLEQQKKLTMTGVESVESFSPTLIVLRVAGKKVQIAGNGLKVLAFNQGSGGFSASGEVSSVKFAAVKTLKRLFQ